MIERIIAASVRNRFLVFVFTLFAIGAGIYALKNTPLDAIPDLSDAQVIVYTDWEGRSPDLVEDQVTYPISTAFIAAPKGKSVRGESMFGKSFVYVIFQDGTDIYWARSRVIEYLNSIRGTLPEGVNPTIGPDATGVGWVYEYALVDDSGKLDLAQLRSIQDWNLRYALESVKGVSEVAPVGGFVKEYQIDLDPNALLAHGIPLSDVVKQVKSSNGDVGGKTFEVATTEYFVRGRGYFKSIADIENVVLKVENGTPVYVKNVGKVHLGGALRRGVAELNGQGEVVGGIVGMRYGENALNFINGVKRKIDNIKSSLPPGVRIVPTYDRSELIHRSISTLREKLIEECIIVALVCLVFLWHVRSALVAIITLPIAILASFIPMFYSQLTSNIMSLGGIAIAIGAMIDAAIIMVENAHKSLEQFREKHGREPNNGERIEVIVAAAKTVGRPLFFSLLVITVRFLPVFSLTAQEGRLFKPLAFTDTLSMFASIVSLKPFDQWPRGMTWEKFLNDLNMNLRTPGMANIFWMPIQTRTEMLTTGFRSALGIKVFGPDLQGIENLAVQIEKAIVDLPDTRSAFAERTVGGYFLDFDVNREAAARYGLTAGDVNDVVETAIGGKTITTTVEARERYPVRARYAPDFRQDLDSLKRVLIPTPTGAQIPISLVADIKYRTGPPSIRNENGQLVGFVLVDPATSDIDGYVRHASKRISERVKFPAGYYTEWAGQFQYIRQAEARLKIVVPLTLLIIFVLLYFNTRSVVKTCIVLLAVPFSLIGAFWLLWLLGYHMSVAVWVGLLALAGLDAETGVVMLLYLDHAWEKFRGEGRMNSMVDLRAAVREGAVQRIRPKMMAVCAILFGLLPIMWASDYQAGADVMKRIAAPMIGGVITSAALNLLIYPVIYVMWRRRHLPKAGHGLIAG